MIGRLKGRVEAVGESHLILDVNGVGYEVMATARVLRGLKIGDEAVLTIDTHVREDAIKLYGFQSEHERSWFRTLQTVQGVGAKVALSVLSVLSAQDLASAIALGNWSAVQEAQGVGKVVAQRIVTELKNKVPAMSFTTSATGGGASERVGAEGVLPEGNAAVEAVSALTNLGYNLANATAAVAAALKDLGTDADTAKLIRRGLKELSR